MSHKPNQMILAEKCRVGQCHDMSVGDGLCEKHAEHRRSHARVYDARPSDWGARTAHPLYKTWNWIIRRYGAQVCERWRDLWNFVIDMDGTQPSRTYALRRTDERLPFGPSNVYWHKQAKAEFSTEEGRIGRNAYMKQWRAANLPQVLDARMRKFFGIGLADYEAMAKAQGFVCAICKHPETSVDRKTMKVRRLAIDHDHDTGTVRGLLCSGCNNGLGSFKDDLENVEAAVAYLRKHEQPRHLLVVGGTDQGV